MPFIPSSQKFCFRTDMGRESKDQPTFAWQMTVSVCVCAHRKYACVRMVITLQCFERPSKQLPEIVFYAAERR